MEIREAIQNRRSVRGFLSKEVPKEVIEEVLQLATRAVSGVNLQPWEFAVVTGEVLDQIKAYNQKAVREQYPEDRTDPEVPGDVFKGRSREIGKALLSAMQITREDKEKRTWWLERGYRFFDAPVVIYLLMDSVLEETAYRFDMGCVAQNICLAAEAYGLGTCVADQAITYQKAVSYTHLRAHET